MTNGVNSYVLNQKDSFYSPKVNVKNNSLLTYIHGKLNALGLKKTYTLNKNLIIRTPQPEAGRIRQFFVHDIPITK